MYKHNRDIPYRILGLIDATYRHAIEALEFILNANLTHVTNGLAHHYHLGGSTFISKGIRSDFTFLFHFSIKSPK